MARDELVDAIVELADFNDDPGAGGITREVFTPLYRTALDWVAERMRAAGLEIREDSFGNLFGSWSGADADAPVVLTGSHVDTTLNAGRYDGVLGVLGAIEAVQLLRERGFEPQRPIEVIAFAGEEPRFGTGCLGSRALVGRLERSDLDRMVDRDGVSLAAALREFGCDPERMHESRIDPDRVHAFLELHIEQGIVLETEGEQIGVVDAIAAPHDLRIVLRGAATHAGATPMRLRRDATVGAAEVIVELERLALGSPTGTTVGTVGKIEVRPGAINVVAGGAELAVDVRDSDAAARDDVVERLLAATREIAARRDLEVEVAQLVVDTPISCSPAVVEAAEESCREAGYSHRRMISGAYHDALIMGRTIPTGMIFVPSVGGVSHHPDELTHPEDLQRGVRVLAGTLARLAGDAQKPSR